MSEVASRPPAPRGRGSGRGGRGGITSRGRGGSRQTNGSKPDLAAAPNFEEEGEIGELKIKYATGLSTVKEMFPDWTDEDIVFALQETDGDLENTIERITEGNISQWEVKKKTKDRSQSKAKEPATSSADASNTSARVGRGRGGADAARGGRGRGSDRARGSSRGARGARAGATPKTNGVSSSNMTSGVAPDTSGVVGTLDSETTTAAAGGWDTQVTETDATPLDSSWEHISADSVKSPLAEEPKPATKPDGSRSWASMFAKPKVEKPKLSKASLVQEAPVESPIPASSEDLDGEVPGLPPPLTEISEIPVTPPVSDHVSPEQAAEITPSKDDLTQTNLEKVPDLSVPPASATVASTAASTIDYRTVSGTPLVSVQQQPQPTRPALGGFQISAYKATGMPGRTSSYQRKILEQQEAVVMPEKHAVDKAAVQFGSMGLNGTPEDLDVDSDREDAETRTQPPQHSPVQPRAALPPAPLQQPPQSLPQPIPSETHSAPRQAPGLPPVSQSQNTQQLPQPPSENQPPAQSAYPYNQFSDRYGQPSTLPEASAPTQKPYEPFGQQLHQAHQYDPFGSAQSTGLGNEARQYNSDKYSSGANNPSSNFALDDPRSAYASHQYGGYGQHQQPGQESSAHQQRTGSALGSSGPSQPSQHTTTQGRFGQAPEAQNSGHSTPYGSVSNQQSGQPQHLAQQSQGPGQQGGYGYGGYPYGGYYSSYNMNQVSQNPFGGERAAFDDARRYDDPYLTRNQQYGGYGGGQGGYGGGQFGGAGGKGMYSQQHPGYGMSPQDSHNQHSASPAPGAFGQQLPGSGRDSAAIGGLSGYGARSGSAQPTENHHQSAQSSMPEMFGRSASNFQGSQGLGASGNEDPLRGYGDSSKVPGGPSPALGQSSARPGSAANPQSSLPPQDARFGQPSGYGGYQGHSQYGGGPAAGGHQSGQQSHQGAGYGGYGAGGYGGNYYGNSNRGGWGANYGH